MFFVSRKKFDLENNGHTKFMVSREHYELQQNNIVKINPQKITSKIKHKVRFDVNGGDSISESERTYNLGSKYGNLPTATKTGQILAGWFTDPTNGTKITKDMEVGFKTNVLYAHYATMTNFTSFEVTTTSSYKKFGIYSTTLKSGSTSQFIDWGDGNVEEVTGNISQKTHEYSSIGTFTVRVSDNITSIAISTNNSTWYRTTSQVYYTLKKILHYSTSMTSIPSYGYYYCYNMTSVSGIGDSNITSLPVYCFYYCYNLSNLNGLSKITSIGTYCFYYCYNLTSFTGIGNITSLPNQSFYNCGRITSLQTLPTSVTSYGQYCLAYTGISDLSKIRTTDTLNSYCFAYMTALKNISTLSPRTTLPSYCFSYCTGLNVADMSNWSSLTSIPSYCFYYCTALTSVTLNHNLKNIQSYAFYCCYASNFKNLNLKDTQVTSIGTYAFQYDYNLTSMSLPSTLTYLYDYSFAGCRNLQQISCYATNAPTTYSNTFGNTTGTGSYAYVGNSYASTGNNRLHVQNPDNYKTSYWNSVLLDSSKCGYNLQSFDTFDITYGKMQGLKSWYLSTGTEIIPDISVYSSNGTLLQENVEWRKELKDNVNVGTAGISAIGISPYHGCLENTFRIVDEEPTMFRYFKMSITYMKSSAYNVMQMSRLEFIDESGNYFNYPSTITATVKNLNNSSWSSGEGIKNLFDHSLYSKYCSSRGSSYPYEIIVDLGSECLDVGIYSRWQWYTANDNATYTGRSPDSFTLQVSNDKTNWTIVDTATNINVPEVNYTLAYTGNITL